MDAETLRIKNIDMDKTFRYWIPVVDNTWITNKYVDNTSDKKT